MNQGKLSRADALMLWRRAEQRLRLVDREPPLRAARIDGLLGLLGPRRQGETVGAWLQRGRAAGRSDLPSAEIIPFSPRRQRFVPVAEQVIARLEEFREPGKSVGLDGAAVRAKEFYEAAARMDASASAEAQRFAAGKGSEAAAQLLNRAMKRLSRILVPLQSTAIGTYGHDPYGYTPQTTMIPCLYDLTELGKLPDGEQRWMLETKMVRARNRVADALQDSTALIDDTLAQLK